MDSPRLRNGDTLLGLLKLPRLEPSGSDDARYSLEEQ
jgi:hypothetical protein